MVHHYAADFPKQYSSSFGFWGIPFPVIQSRLKTQSVFLFSLRNDGFMPFVSGKGNSNSLTQNLNVACLSLYLSLSLSLYLSPSLSIYIYVYIYVWLVGFYGISTFVGYLTPNPFLCKKSVLFQTFHFSVSTLFNCEKHFYFKLFSLVKQFQFS